MLKNGINFLFDLAHARITAHNRRIAYEDYAAGLPLDRLIQVHISKHKINEYGMAYDAHELPDEMIFSEVSGLLDKYPCEYVTIEHYRPGTGLIEALRKYMDLCRETEGAGV